MKCDLCQFETENRERFAGHRSAHVRRGEAPKRVRSTEHVCKFCGKQFDTGTGLGGHIQIHNREFEELRSSGTRKHFLIRERGRRCEICKFEMWMGQPIPLTLDHIDGNSINDVKDNLRLLCPNCHAQTPTFCGKNVGRFPGGERYKAMQKYRKQITESISAVDCLAYTQEDAGSNPASPTHEKTD